MISKGRTKLRLIILLVALFISQGCDQFASPTPSPVGPTATIPPDFITNVQIVVSAIEANQPEVFHSLIGEEGVAVGGFAQGLDFKGYDNSDEIVEAFSEALDQSTPVCEGFFPYIGGLPDKAIIVYRGINLDWQRFGMSGSNSDAMTIQLFKLPEGWRLIYLTPLKLERDLPLLGTLQACPPVSSLTHATEFHTPKPTKTQISSSPTITLTPVPPGNFVLLFYPALVMNYDPSVWEDKSNYAEWGLNFSTQAGIIVKNYLQSLSKVCQIGVIGPSGYFPLAEEIVQLGDVRYQLTTSDNEQFEVRTGHYIEDQSLIGYNYDRYGFPVLEIIAPPSEWDECKKLGENVLATLHVP